MTTTLARERGDRLLLSIDQAAAYLGVTDRTIRNYISRGHLRAYRVGNRLVRLDAGDLDAMLRPIPTSDRGPGVA